jgi:putative transposase
MGFAYKIHDQQGVYFITCTVVQWVDIFTRKRYADIVVGSLNYCCEHTGLEVLGWVIMSNHIHLIVSCKEGYRLSDILRDFKKYTSSQIVAAIESDTQESRKSWLLWLLKKDGNIQLWQPDNHAIEIDKSEIFLQRLNYIHQNPVRAGITDREETYMYSSSSDFHGRKGLIMLTDFY